MSIEQQKYRASPPAYSLTTPGGMENEIYIDDTSQVDQDGQGRYCVKENQSNKNACGQIFRVIRSNFFLLFIKTK